MHDVDIMSICGQLERIAAEIMIENGEARRIALADFPTGAPRQDALGQPAAFAIVIPRTRRSQFESLVAELRA